MDRPVGCFRVAHVRLLDLSGLIFSDGTRRNERTASGLSDFVGHQLHGFLAGLFGLLNLRRQFGVLFLESAKSVSQLFSLFSKGFNRRSHCMVLRFSCDAVPGRTPLSSYWLVSADWLPSRS